MYAKLASHASMKHAVQVLLQILVIFDVSHRCSSLNYNEYSDDEETKFYNYFTTSDFLNYTGEITHVDVTLGTVTIELSAEFECNAFHKANVGLLCFDEPLTSYNYDYEGNSTVEIRSHFGKQGVSFCQNDTCSRHGNICSQNLTLNFKCVPENSYYFYVLPHNFNQSPEVETFTRVSTNFIYIYTSIPSNYAIFDDMFLRKEYFYEDKQELVIDTSINKTLLKILTGSESAENKFTVYLIIDDDSRVNCEEYYNIDARLEVPENTTIYGATIVTVFENVTNGASRFCIRYNLIDNASYCVREKSWVKSIDVLQPNIPDFNNPHNKTLQILILSCAIFFAIVVLGVIFVEIRRTNPYSYKPCDKTYMKKFSRAGSLSNPQEVLLVYARDCPQFMETVKHFTSLLRNYCCTVYDIFNEDYAEEISQRPQDWLFEKISSDRVKVILLLNPCGVHLKDAANPQLLYRIGHCFDQLYPYAINLLMNRQYTFRTKLFIALAVDEDDSKKSAAEYYENFNCIPADTRYFLPKHYRHLVANLRNVKLECIDAKEKIFKEFERTCEDTKERYRDNAKYYRQILNNVDEVDDEYRVDYPLV